MISLLVEVINLYMEKRTLYQITNVSKINNLPKNASFEDCLCCMLEQDFKYNKYIHPDTLQIFKHKLGLKINFENNYFKTNEKEYKISYQLKCAFFILKYLRKYACSEISNYFFENDSKYGKLSKNIKVEVRKPGILDDHTNYRVDIELKLINGYKIIIEINENAHEDDGKRIKELNRARQLLDDDKKICKFYIIREKFVKSNYKNLRYIIKKKIIPFMNEILHLHNERSYVINKLVELTFEEWRPLCELTYDSHLDPNKPIIDIRLLNNFFDFEWNNNFKLIVKQILDSQIITTNTNLNYDDLDDLLSDVEMSDDEDNKNEIENVENYYLEEDNNINLTWKGFNTYLTFIVKFLDNINKTKTINEFNYKIHTEFVNVLKEQRNHLINLNESYKIWGYRNEDYNFI